MATARELCTAALEYWGAVGVGEDPTDDDLQRVFSELNDLIDSWSIDNLLIYCDVTENFAFSAGVGSYTIGSGATWNTTRPLSIKQAFIRIDGIDYPVSVISREAYNDIQAKTIEATPGGNLYYDPAFPNGVVYLWAVPSASGTIYLTSSKQFTRFATIDDTVTFPPGYARALKWNLITEAAEYFGKTPSAGTLAKARGSKNDLRVANTKPMAMKFDIPASKSSYSIYTDGNR